MKKLFVFFAVLSIVALPVFAGAASVRVGENYTLAKGEVVDGNFYAAGANLTLSGDVKGDVSAVGSIITLKGNISEDVALAGGTIMIDGVVADDARLAGGTIVVSGAVGGDLALAGGTVKVIDGATVAGDMLVAGGTVIIDGDVKGDIRLTGGNVTINGAVGGSILNYAEHLILGATAVVTGNLTNYVATEAVLETGAVVKGTVSNDVVVTPRDFRSMIAAAGTMNFLMFLFAGLICYWLFKNRSKQFTAHALAHFWKELLRGLILLVAVLILAIALLISVVGFPFGIVLLLTYVIIAVLARVFAGIMLGGWINKVIFKKPDQVLTWQTVIGGNVVLLLLSFVPVIGGIISFMFTMVAFGAFWGYLYRHFWANR
jgi:cytoskeletal protein CcmA (bactofilin family)